MAFPVVPVIDAENVDADDESGKALIGDDEIAAAAENEERETSFFGPGKRFAKMRLICDFGEIAGCATDAERRERG
jgi:hypothetical protein